MNKVKTILKNIYNNGLTDREAEDLLKQLEKDDLIDFILWHFNRSKFNDLIRFDNN